MKRNLLLLILLAGSISWVPARPQNYSVAFLMGAAWVKSGADWEPLKIGNVIALGDSLKVGPESRIELSGPTQEVIKIGANFKNRLTPQVIAALLPAQRDGSTLSKLVRGKSEMEIQTPTAVAAIRGKTAGPDQDESGETGLLSEAELTSLLEETATAPVTEDDGVSDPVVNARALLEEAVRLRAQVDQLLSQNRVAAASSALEMSEKLTRQALALLEGGTAR